MESDGLVVETVIDEGLFRAASSRLHSLLSRSIEADDSFKIKRRKEDGPRLN